MSIQVHALFKLPKSIKFKDLVTLNTLVFMYHYHNQLLPSFFDTFFTPVTEFHSCNTHTASKQSYYLPYVRTNYLKFNT